MGVKMGDLIAWAPTTIALIKVRRRCKYQMQELRYHSARSVLNCQPICLPDVSTVEASAQRYHMEPMVHWIQRCVYRCTLDEQELILHHFVRIIEHTGQNE